MTPTQQAVIFDWNGTLLDDTQLCVDATNVALAPFGGGPASLAQYQKDYAIPLRPFYLSLGCSVDAVDNHIDDILSVWQRHYNERVHHVGLRDGAQQLLAMLKESGHLSAILSNHTVAIITAQLERLAIEPYFNAVLANADNEFNDLMNKADKGSRLKEYVQRYDIRQALVVGDSAEEIEIARRYGFWGVALSGGFVSDERLVAASPDFMISSLAELPEIVRRVFGNRGKP